MHIEEDPAPIEDGRLSLPDQWILMRLARVTRQTSLSLDNYKFNEAATAIYQFVWHEVCDWYLEAIKPTLYDDTDIIARRATRQVLWTVLHDALLLLHPFAPFVTEEIWEKLPGTRGSIMQAEFPKTDRYPRDETAETQMDFIMGVITGIRNIRGEMNITPSAALQVIVQSENAAIRTLVVNQSGIITNLARLADLKVQDQGMRSPTSATAIVGEAVILVELQGVVDFSQEIQRLEKEIGKLDKELVGINKKLSNDSFLSKAPGDVVAQVRDKQDNLTDKRDKLKATLERVRSFV